MRLVMLPSGNLSLMASLLLLLTPEEALRALRALLEDCCAVAVVLGVPGISRDGSFEVASYGGSSGNSFAVHLCKDEQHAHMLTPAPALVR